MAAPARGLRERACGLDLGSHRPFGKRQLGERFGVGPCHRSLARLSPVEVQGVDVGGDHQHVCVDVSGQAGAGVILVDHALDPDQAPAGRRRIVGVHRRNAAAAGADDDAPSLDQPLDRPQSDDSLGTGGRDDSPDAVTIGMEAPALALGQTVGLLAVVDRPDRLRWPVERRVGGVDLDHGQQRGDRGLGRKQVAELLLDQVADHALGLGVQHIQWVRLDLAVG